MAMLNEEGLLSVQEVIAVQEAAMTALSVTEKVDEEGEKTGNNVSSVEMRSALGMVKPVRMSLIDLLETNKQIRMESNQGGGGDRRS
ncbi:hypothetical protein DVH24_010441 [Malus domestica]|uniref:Uncharacterized protein n=1 Tax=Malus domestica TaxID=3750 RepID=A0A498JST7_MALDO|nr:hypothetical protein DVH24_010441 [Malus domestica]